MPAPDLTAEQQQLVQRVTKPVQHAERTLHTWQCRRFDHFYGQWSSFQELKGDLTARRDRRDRDMGLAMATREWGGTLFIPWTFSIIESTLPRVVANRPQMLVLPRTPRSESNVQNMKWMVEAQQEQAQYELKLQSTAKNGLIFGLGWQKSMWRRSMVRKPQIVKATIPTEAVEWVRGDPEMDVLWDDPDALNISPYDVLYDPAATSMLDCSWIVHRVWRNTAYVMNRINSGLWNMTPGLTEEDVAGSSMEDKYSSSWAARMKAQGNSNFSLRGHNLHEILEYHDGQDIVVVLDRRYPMMQAKNPDYRGKIPFHCYRPTERPDQMCGVGEAEAVEDLQDEMNVLRTQRRDNATLKLMQTYAYDDGAVDPDDVKVQPGGLVPVNGNPRDLLFPLMVGDIPNSGYQEEARLIDDFERTSGLSDVVTGAGLNGGTATEAQLLTAAASERIKLKTRRLESEVVAAQTAVFAVLSQARILDEKFIRIPYVPKQGEPDRRWAWVRLTPEEIAGEFAFVCDGGMEAENVPQNRADAAFVMQNLLPLAGQLPIDVQKLLVKSFELMGWKNPEQYITAQATVPPQVLPILEQLLIQNGVPQQVAGGLIGMALNQAQGAQQQLNAGPGANAPAGPSAAGDQGVSRPAGAAP